MDLRSQKCLIQMTIIVLWLWITVLEWNCLCLVHVNTIGIKLSIYIQQVGHVQLQETILKYVKKICSYWYANEPRHEKTCFCHMQTTKVQISLHTRAFWSGPLLFAPRQYTMSSYYIRNLKPLANLWQRRPVCVLPGLKPQWQVFSWRGSNYSLITYHLYGTNSL